MITMPNIQIQECKDKQYNFLKCKKFEQTIHQEIYAIQPPWKRVWQFLKNVNFLK